MKLALKQAQLAYGEGEIPIGAVVVNNDKVIARAYNQVQKLNDPTAHAEMLAITAACHALGAKYLTGCSLYVTMEPCFMCAGAIKWAQIPQIVYGATDPKAGYTLLGHRQVFPAKIKLVTGVLEHECSQIVLDFFQELRGRL